MRTGTQSKTKRVAWSPPHAWTPMHHFGPDDHDYGPTGFETCVHCGDHRWAED